MFSTDGILFDGPLAHLAPDRSAEITKIHHLAKLALIALVILHLAAILVYKFGKKVNLTLAMVSGRASERRHDQGAGRRHKPGKDVVGTGVDGWAADRHTRAAAATASLVLSPTSF